MKKIKFDYNEDAIIEAICERYEPEEELVGECMAERGLSGEEAIMYLKETYEPTQEEMDNEESDQNESRYDDYWDSKFEQERDERNGL